MKTKAFTKVVLYKLFYVFIHATNKIFSNGVSFQFPFLGNANPFVLFVKNLVRPSRIFTKFRYGQLGPLSRISSKAAAIPNNVIETARHDNNFDQYAKDFKENGVCIIDGYFEKPAKELADSVYFAETSNNDRFQGYDKMPVDPFTDRALFEIMTNPVLLGITACYLHAQPFMRSRCGILWVNPEMEQSAVETQYRDETTLLAEANGTIGANVKPGDTSNVPKSNRNALWHYDTPNNITAIVILKENGTSDSYLKYAARTHRKHHMQILPLADYEYSEDYVNRHYRVVDCVGSSGTLVLIDTNGLHRLECKTGRGRMHLAWCMGPGNNPNFARADDPVYLRKKPAAPPSSTDGLMRGQTDFFHYHPDAPESFRIGVDPAT